MDRGSKKMTLSCVVVTGASGFIGQALIHFLAEKNIKVLGITRSHKPEMFQSSQVRYINCSMEEYYRLPDLLDEDVWKPDVFYHLAWDGTNGKKRADYQRQCLNAIYACDAIIAAKKMGCKRFIMAGTITENVADDLLKHGYLSENIMYGLTKSFTHKLIDIVARQQEMDYIWAQLSNIYGGKNASGNLISYTMQELRSGNIPTYGPCEQPYNFTYIDDVLSALYLLGNIEKHCQNAYFVSNGECRTLKDYLCSIAQIMGGEVGIGMRADDGVRYQEAWFDNKSIQDELDFKPKYNFEDGLKEMLVSESHN